MLGKKGFMVLVFLFVFLCGFISASDSPLLVYRQKALVPEDKLVLSHDYSVSKFSGSSTYSYSIEVPKGINNMQLDLKLIYNHQRIKGAPGFTGSGWKLSQTYITRDVEDTWNYDNDDSFFLSLNGAGYKLVPRGENKYATEKRSFFDIEKFNSGGNNTLGEYWVVKTKDGTTCRLGYNNDSELVSNMYSYATQWSVDKVNDTFGNSVFYFYLEDPYVNDKGTVYPEKIEYNNRSVEFIYESIDRPNMWEIYSHGNHIKYSRLMSDVVIKVEDDLVKRYHFDYSDWQNTVLDFLENITIIGEDNSTSLPPVSFYYNNVNEGWGRSGFLLPIAIPTRDHGIRFVDLNNDGFLDIVQGYCDTENDNDCVGNELEFGSWINNGSGFIENSSWEIPMYITQYKSNNGTNRIDNGVRFGYN